MRTAYAPGQSGTSTGGLSTTPTWPVIFESESGDRSQAKTNFGQVGSNHLFLSHPDAFRRATLSVVEVEL